LAHAEDITLTSSLGFSRTCTSQLQQKETQKRSDAQAIAWVVCRDTDLARNLITWATQGFKRIQSENLSIETIVAEVGKKIDEVIGHMGQTRRVLAKLQLHQSIALRVSPSQWQIDLNGDGEISVWEKYFFAIPERNSSSLHFGMPHENESYYQQHYQADAQIDVDQSDVLWALAYHQFIEGLLVNIRAFEVHPSDWSVSLERPVLLATAHRLIGDGFATSERMRHTVLTETDDSNEWIANPNQKNSVFPLALDADDFQTWRAAMSEAQATWQGNHLLPTSRNGRGILAQIAPLCAENQGLNIAQLYLKPPPKGFRISLSSALPDFGKACKTVTKAQPLSRMEEIVQRGKSADAIGMKSLRYLYWIN